MRDRIPVSVALFEIGRARPEDVLLCPDGSCGLCHVGVDGVKKLACQAQVHKGMAIMLPSAEPLTTAPLCPWDVTQEQVLERMSREACSPPKPSSR